ncbi:MAG: Zn-dependent hydrolase, including glyoxylase [uncultured Acidilobus sp. MG]|nr:MAG: Zn-dependent hydrolase, including glyoxylase [uncultured Acidilobus sp. MG]
MKALKVKVDIPIAALGHVNAYALVSEPSGGFVLVDPGMYWAEGLESLGRGLRALGLRPCDAEAYVVTHFHVDHATAAPLLASLCPAPVYIGEKDLRAARGGFESYFNGVLELYRRYGVPPQELEAMRGVHPAPRLARVYDELAELARPLAEGNELRVGDEAARVIEVPGHTPGHIALLINGGREAIVGDSLLNDITPHVVLDNTSRDALGEYLRTLRRLQGEGIGVAWPGHRDEVRDVARRAAEIEAHHEERLRQVLAMISASPATLYDVARRLRWRTRAATWADMSPYERYFAVGEALAHLVRLVRVGLAEEVVTREGIVFRSAQR